jgi:eukaryotic-like serine/threonine-protein kinase
MPDDSSIQELLEEILESGKTPEEVCADHPELLREVCHRLRRVQSMQAQIDDLFPSSDAASEQVERARSRDLSGKPPNIPGYEVQSFVGRGGMGVVYKARHLKLNRIVAIKMLLSGVYASPSERARFLREADSVARLSHPNVVQVYDMGEFDGRPYFTMEFVESGTLARRLTGVPWSAGQAAALIFTLAQGVEAAHRAGIVHRDLKPGNILLTPDGTPKISDFGLARRVDDDLTITLTGVKVGTPSYMAPEQALGQTSAIEAAVDVYALGAILYELLTGRPPFRAETASETQRQLIANDPAPPSRLNAKVPRDLETICLKCLHKDPHRRYWTTLALAQDLERFQRNEPIVARRTGVFERSSKWMRRHPATTVAVVSVLLLVVVLIWMGFLSAMQGAHLEMAVDGDLKAVSILQQEARWSEARAALDRAEALVTADGNRSLRQVCARADRDLDLVIQLDNIRLDRATSGNLIIYRQIANEQYAGAFTKAGLGTSGEAPTEVASRVNVSPIRPELVAALDDWAFSTTEITQRNWVMAVARAAEPDPRGWNQRILDPAHWEDTKTISELANTVPADSVPLPLLLALGERLHARGVDVDGYLRRVQREYPGDFWANLTLGNMLFIREPAEAREYYRAALAIRPEASVGYCAVGDTLRLQGLLDESIIYYRKSLEQDPNYARGYSNLGLSFQAQGKLADAIDAYRKSIELDPKYAWSYMNLGNALQAQGKTNEAIEQYKNAVAVEPNNSATLGTLRDMLMREGHGEAVWAAWHDIIKTNPPRFDDWWGYLELTLYLGKEDEYRSTRTAMLKQFGDSTDPMITEKIGRACLMLPASPEEMRVATTLIDRAVAAKDSVGDWMFPYFMVAKGLAEYRAGHFDSAIAILRKYNPTGLGPSSNLILAMALYRQGNRDAAEQTLAEAIANVDWNPSHAVQRDIWLAHILRREAQALILPGQPMPQ